MGKRIVTVTCTILLVISMLVSSTAAKTSKDHDNSAENFNIDQTDGLQFDEYLNLSGSSIFPASELTWYIYEVLPEVEFSQNIINQSNIFERVTIEGGI